MTSRPFLLSRSVTRLSDFTFRRRCAINDTFSSLSACPSKNEIGASAVKLRRTRNCGDAFARLHFMQDTVAKCHALILNARIIYCQLEYYLTYIEKRGGGGVGTL